ncbi:hypothetical protein C8Q73DRAFT_743881 [Cubamyces lactineus]|nr:hypothetical protein C8Q73DRAFT_743881 [Cubamyces lactineus]
MGELSLRHIPDLSDVSVNADFSDASFQIPRTLGNTDDLLADDTMDFFNGANDTLSTPAPPSRPMQPPLTLAELTPRSKPMRAVPVRSSLRPRPGIATPYRSTIADELTAAISEELSPFRHQDPSFQIPSSQSTGEALLMADNDAEFLGKEGDSELCSMSPHAQSPLTSSQLSPGPAVGSRPPSSALPNQPTIPSPHLPTPNIVPTDTRFTGISEGEPAVSHATTPSAVGPGPLMSSVHHDCNILSTTGEPADKGKVKEPQKVNLAERQKKLPGGDKAKRKRVTPAAAVTKPARLKPLTASLARRLSNAGRKPVPGMRRRPLQGGSVTTSVNRSSGGRADPAAQATSATVRTRTNVKPAQGGGLADTLLSFGQKLLARAASPEHHGEASTDTGNTSHSVSEAAAHSPSTTDYRSDLQPVGHLGSEPTSDPSYLTISQLSPRKAGADRTISTATLASGSHITEQTPIEALDHFTAAPQVSEPVSRAGSPSGEHPAHQRKRSKTASGSSGPTSSKESAPRKPALQPSRARNVPATAATAATAPARRTVSASVSSANLRVKAEEARKLPTSGSRSLSRSGPGGEADDAKKAKDPGSGPGEIPNGDSGAHVSSASGSRRSGGAGHSQREIAPGARERQAGQRCDGQASIRGPSPVDRPSSNLPSAKPTRPMEFQFATSTRIESRRAELEKSGGMSSSGSNGMSLRRSKASTGHPIPDFKALHAMQQSVLAQRKAEIVPVVPLPIELQTEARAHEREKFEEARRAREAELERQREERRRQQELEEEREIKELRKRAVPKANAVPEWYAFAPKKSKPATGK